MNAMNKNRTNINKHISPMERAAKSRRKTIIILTGAISFVILGLLVNGVINNHQSSDDYSALNTEDSVPQIRDQINIKDNVDLNNENLGAYKMQATIISEDTIIYNTVIESNAKEDTKGKSISSVPSASVIISRVADNINSADVEKVIEHQLGPKETSKISQYEFPKGSIWSGLMGYQCLSADQKIIIGYYLDKNGYLYNITFSVKANEFRDVFDDFLKFASRVTFNSQG